MRSIFRRGRADEGATALEFALLAPLLITIVAGMVEFGLLFQANLAVTAAAREGARILAVNDGAEWDAGRVQDAAYPLTTADGLVITPNNAPADHVVVTVRYPWTWRILPLGVLNLGAPPVLEGRATMRKE